MPLSSVGIRNITATYMGDDRFNQSTSAAVEHKDNNVGVIITQPDNKTTLEEGGSSTETYEVALSTIPPEPVISHNQIRNYRLHSMLIMQGWPVDLYVTADTPQSLSVPANEYLPLDGIPPRPTNPPRSKDSIHTTS
ncbi:hypothetical protein BGS_1241 [Beggiatoa sp. SS]|nr:hypothetical protein BGS_1241 [Beggiatoa sp. SS]